MSVRSCGYDNDTLDAVLCYFMRTVLHLQETGVEKLPLEHSLPEPVAAYMDIAMELLTGGTPPEISEIILEAEHDVLVSRGEMDIDTAVCLRTIREVSCHIRFDEDCYGYLLNTCNLWGNRALEYASRTFYPRLPEEIREKYGIDALIRYVPPEMFRLEDY